MIDKWTFDMTSPHEEPQLCCADALPRTVFLHFIDNVCIGSETRFNYTRQDAESLVDYLNARNAT